MCKITNMVHGYPKKHKVSIKAISIALFNRYNIDVSESSLQAYFSPDHKTPLPAYLVVPICEICNNDFSILDLMEADAKRTAMNVSCDSQSEINYKTVAMLAKESGEAISALAKTIDTKHATPDEIRICISEILDMQRAATEVLMKFHK